MGITLIQQQIEDKSIIWFSSSNQYVVLENKTADMITQINDGVSLKEISNNLKDEFNISIEEAELFIKDIHENLYIPNSVKKENIETKTNSYTLPKFGKTKFYKINGLFQRQSTFFEIQYSLKKKEKQKEKQHTGKKKNNRRIREMRIMFQNI